MTVTLFGKYTAPKSTPITADLDGWKPIEGAPTMKTWIEHKTPDGKFLTGFWEATPGTYHVTYTADELVHMFEGKLRSPKMAAKQRYTAQETASMFRPGSVASGELTSGFERSLRSESHKAGCGIDPIPAPGGTR